MMGGPAFVVMGILLLCLIFLGCVSFLGYFLNLPKKIPTSPYVDAPLRKASFLPRETKIAVVTYLKSLQSYDNRPFSFESAAFCRETGRIFPQGVTWFGTLHVDWSFLSRRYPGRYISFGSISKQLREEILAQHGDLSGYNFEDLSQQPAPKDVEIEYAYAKPGPLYVDVETGVLLGWKEVPGTMVEVLIVHKPLRII